MMNDHDRMKSAVRRFDCGFNAKRARQWMLLLVVCLASSTVLAGVGVSAKVGTQGLGADLTLDIIEQLNLRVGFNALSADFDYDGDDDNTYLAEINLQTIPVMLDWHPFSGDFRITAGLVLNENEVTGSVEPGEDFEFNDADYQLESLSAELSFDDMGTYIGIGFGDAANSSTRFNLTLDIGAMYHGTPELTATATASNAALQAELNRNLAIEVADANEDLESFKWYPVISVGLSYRF
jgi:hypothetical protein